MKAIPYPNFFIVGAPKCGTTALSEYLRLHPNVFFCDPKEPEYFATDFKGRLIFRERDYLRLFREVDIERHLAIGEGSVVYVFSKEAVPNLLECQPDAKIIVMLRNPVALVVSLHAQLLMTGQENITLFLDAWNAERERHSGQKIPLGCRDPQWLYYSEWGKLGTMLNRLMNIVPANQLKVILYDDFAKDTRRIYLETLRFLVVPDDGRVEFPIVNERRVPKNVHVKNIMAVAMRLWLPWRSRLTLGRGLGLGKYLDRFIAKPANKEELLPETRRMLVEFYKDEVSILEEILCRDLSHWKSL